ncbi:alpha/beta hydrolase family protein [uncultured Arsenicicoccus sp.]|nr:alpha/beta hydrolase-fold protein [uncultured Arsenicicoccus sp.]
MDRRSLLRLTGGLSLAGALGACSSTSGGVTSTSATSTPTTFPPERIDGGTFRSRLRGNQDTPWLLLYPPGYGRGARLPVLITLHGTGSGEETPWILRWPETSEALAKEGLPPFACAGVAGGDTWWHRRTDGTDSGAMVIEELIPLLASRGLDTRRVSLYGYSMGGVGAIYLATQLRQPRVASVVAASTPFIPSFEVSQGAYDSPADFAQHDIRTLWPRLSGIPVRVDIGEEDQFLQTNRDFIPTARPAPEFHISPGGHNREFWGGVALDELRFVARHL